MAVPEPYFLKLQDTRETAMLLRYPNEYALLTLIALRARWGSSDRPDELKPGEAHLGDYSACGLSRQQFRTACRHLEEWQLAEFRKLNGKGTIGRLKGREVFDIRVYLEQPASNQLSNQLSNQQSNQLANQLASDENACAARVFDADREEGNQLANQQSNQLANHVANQKLTSNREIRTEKKKNKKRERARACGDFGELMSDERFAAVNDPTFRAEFLEWIAYRSESKWPLSRRAIELNLLDALKVGTKEAVRRMQKAMKHGYRGWYFEDEGDGSGFEKKARRAGDSEAAMETRMAALTGARK